MSDAKSIRVTVWWLVFLTTLFVVLGCAGVYRALQLPEDTIQELVTEDTENVTTVVREVRSMFWETVYAALAALGGCVSGFLATRLRKANQVTTAVILGVEKSNGKKIKANIAAEAIKLGVEPTLHKRVKALTPTE